MNTNSGTLPQKTIAGYSGSYSGIFKTMLHSQTLIEKKKKEKNKISMRSTAPVECCSVFLANVQALHYFINSDVVESFEHS